VSKINCSTRYRCKNAHGNASLEASQRFTAIILKRRETGGERGKKRESALKAAWERWISRNLHVRMFHARRHVPGQVPGAGKTIRRHQSLSSNKYAPSNFRKEFASRLPRRRGSRQCRRADSWISDIARGKARERAVNANCKKSKQEREREREREKERIRDAGRLKAAELPGKCSFRYHYRATSRSVTRRLSVRFFSSLS